VAPKFGEKASESKGLCYNADLVRGRPSGRLHAALGGGSGPAFQRPGRRVPAPVSLPPDRPANGPVGSPEHPVESVI